MNLEDRGEENLRKRQYMSALTCDKVALYEPKISSALKSLVKSVTKNPEKGIIGTWQELNLDLFLDLHFGAVKHPEYVRRYFARSFSTVANLGGICNPLDPDMEILSAAYCEVEEVKKYIEERLNKVLEDDDDTAIIYHWSKAGLPPLAIAQEAEHNTLASLFGSLLSIL